MHAEKIRTAYSPSLRLNPREALIFIAFAGIATLLLGLFIGIMS